MRNIGDEKILVNYVHEIEVEYLDGREDNYLVLSKCLETYDGVWDVEEQITKHIFDCDTMEEVSATGKCLGTMEPQVFSAWVDEAMLILGECTESFHGFYFWDGKKLCLSYDKYELLQGLRIQIPS